MNVAALGLAVDSSQADKGTVSLNKFAGAAHAAEAAAMGLAIADRSTAGAAAQVASSANAAAAGLNNQAGAAQRAGAAMKVANDNSRRMGGSFSGLAAQFQDIGVTAAMGMNPAIIALQQGTQIAGQMEAAIHAGGSAVGVLKQAFTSLFSPLSFVVIAMTALAAAGLQMVDWTGLVQGGLRLVADNMQVIAPYAIAAAAGMALLYTPAMLGGLASVGTLLYTIEGAMLAIVATIGWPALLIAGIVALGGVAVAFRDDITAYLGIDIVGAAKAGANYLIQAFMVAWERIKTTWQQLPNMIEAAVTGAKNFFTGGTENAGADRMSAGYAEMQKRIAGIMGSDPLGALGDGISKTASALATTLKGWATGLDEVDGKTKKAAERAAKNYAEIVLGANQFIAARKLERESLGLTEHAANRLRHEQDLLNKAANDNIKLTPQQTAELKALAASMADAEAETSAAKKAFEFAKDTVKGFVSDLRSGLAQGESFWQSFGNAALNVLDKITDKLLNEVIDALFQVGNAGSGSGGFFGSIFKAIGGLFGGGSGGVQPNARGGVYSAPGLSAYSNQIVSKPTIFPFAKGAGLMGEAGPEAIMPLRRGPNGRLGVEASGSAGGGSMQVDVRVFVDDNGNWDAKVERIADGRVAAGVRSYDRQIAPKRAVGAVKDNHRAGNSI